MTYQAPDENGFYGKFGGRFVPETLMKAVKELDEAYQASKTDPA
ncbi:tryptophan synthase subunit beta, partial [Listeria monocytogenes]|nr:tryptophan synthase subunit beta [Listeria monocytogenes]EGY0048825.1 tryptophan synthase subunit beta [Listeria monocytogenes]